MMSYPILGLCVTCDQVYSVIASRNQGTDEPTSFCSEMCEVIADREFKYPAHEESVLLPRHCA